MKLSKFNKKLKEEYNDTINPIELKEEKRNYNPKHKFKLRYVILPILAIFILYLVVDHIAVSISNEDIKKYNNSISYEKIDYSKVELSEKKYTSKLDLEKDILKIEYPERKYLKKSILEKIFSFQLIGCTSADKTSSKNDRIDGQIPLDKTTTGDNSYETNVVEKSIDEADVSKSDGKYIYSLVLGSIFIYDLEGNTVCKKSFLNIPNGLYIYNDKIIILFYENVSIYEFKDSKLELKKEYNYQLVNSRLYENNLFVIFNEELDLDKINYDNCYYDSSINPNYLFRIFKIDLNNLEELEADLVTTDNNQLYMSNNYIYFTSRIYSYYISDNVYNYTNFFIIDHDLNGYSCFKETGYLLNKYSFSEYEGYFRFLMINPYNSNNIYNDLYVYDLENKNMVSEFKGEIGLAYEYAKSVRFMKDKCYVCTFRNTDPLYLIDLSDPYDVNIISELHVSGYSDYLHYFNINDEIYILGVGYSEEGFPKISIYKEENNELVLYKYNLVLTNISMGKMINFENEKYLEVTGYRYLVGNAIGYFFYIKNGILYFGSQVGAIDYYMFKIDVNSDDLFTVYDKYESNNICVSDRQTYLRCFLINSKLYYVGDGKITIKDFN